MAAKSFSRALRFRSASLSARSCSRLCSSCSRFDSRRAAVCFFSARFSRCRSSALSSRAFFSFALIVASIIAFNLVFAMPCFQRHHRARTSTPLETGGPAVPPRFAGVELVLQVPPSGNRRSCHLGSSHTALQLACASPVPNRLAALADVQRRLGCALASGRCLRTAAGSFEFSGLRLTQFLYAQVPGGPGLRRDAHDRGTRGTQFVGG